MVDSIGRKIQRLRELQGWSQLELSRRARLSTSAISQFESGNRNPSSDAIRKLSEAFEVTTDYFLNEGGKEDSTNQMPEFVSMYRKLNQLNESERAKLLKTFGAIIDSQHPDQS